MKSEFTGNPDFKWVDKISRFMDSKFTIPGTKFKFGLDPVIGLIPVAGEATTFAISGVLIFYMAKYGVSRKVIILMFLNVLLDTIFGAIPIIGSIFDFAYKSNNRNIELLKKHYEQGKYQGSGTGIIVLILVIFFIVFVLLVYGLFKLFSYLYHLL